MALLYKQWDEPRTLFGDLAVVVFLLTQMLDGAFTYLGVSIWGPGVEANPLIVSAIGTIGILGGIGAAKIVSISFGIMLHLRRVHYLVATLTLIYMTGAILPWTAFFLTN
jgi:hypothetical protein